MEKGSPPRLHFVLRCIFFMAAGGAAGLILAGLSIQQWSIDWRVVAILAVAGASAASLDVLLFERNQWSFFRAITAWAAGFLFLTLLMAIVLVIPYAILAGVSKAFGLWDAWESLAMPWSLLIPLLVGTVIGCGSWRLLDDY